MFRLPECRHNVKFIYIPQFRWESVKEIQPKKGGPSQLNKTTNNYQHHHELAFRSPNKIKANSCFITNNGTLQKPFSRDFFGGAVFLGLPCLMLGTSSFKVFSEHDILTLIYHGAKWKVTFNKSKKVATNKRTPFWVVKQKHGKFHWFIDAPSFCVFFQVPFSMKSLLNHLTLRNTGSQNWSGLEIPTNPLKYREIPFSLDGPSWFLGHTPEI